PLGPDLLSCGDSDVTLRLAFHEQSMDWTIENRSKQPIEFRIALAPKVAVTDASDGSEVTLKRDRASLRITGIDSVTNGTDGKMLQVRVAGGETKRISLKAATQK